jgi:hypothetical protein
MLIGGIRGGAGIWFLITGSVLQSSERDIHINEQKKEDYLLWNTEDTKTTSYESNQKYIETCKALHTVAAERRGVVQHSNCRFLQPTYSSL